MRTNTHIRIHFLRTHNTSLLWYINLITECMHSGMQCRFQVKIKNLEGRKMTRKFELVSYSERRWLWCGVCCFTMLWRWCLCCKCLGSANTTICPIDLAYMTKMHMHKRNKSNTPSLPKHKLDSNQWASSIAENFFLWLLGIQRQLGLLGIQCYRRIIYRRQQEVIYRVDKLPY